MGLNCYIISYDAGLGEQSIARLDSASSLQSARCSHRSSQCERPQRCRELRADWELQCGLTGISSARERPRARVPAICGSWILVSLPVWSLSAIWRGFQKLLPIAYISFLDGLQPIQTHCKHRISNCSAHFQLPVELYVRATGDRMVHAPRCGALAPSCTLHRRCRALLCTILHRHLGARATGCTGT